MRPNGVRRHLADGSGVGDGAVDAAGGAVGDTTITTGAVGSGDGLGDGATEGAGVAAGLVGAGVGAGVSVGVASARDVTLGVEVGVGRRYGGDRSGRMRSGDAGNDVQPDARHECRGREREPGGQHGDDGDGGHQRPGGAQGAAQDLHAKLGKPRPVLVTALTIGENRGKLALLEAGRRLDRRERSEQLRQPRHAPEPDRTGRAAAHVIGEDGGVRVRQRAGHEGVDQVLGGRAANHTHLKPDGAGKVAPWGRYDRPVRPDGTWIPFTPDVPGGLRKASG